MLSAWLERIEGLHPAEIEMGLARVREVVERGGWGHFACPVVTVGGTNGKGSCIALMEAMLLGAGYRVAAYTSPHLHVYNERLRINGQSVDDDRLCRAFEQVEQLRQNTPLTFFEFTTVAVFSILQSIELDIVLLEVGLGGRLDAVNVVDPDIAVITGIDLDHMADLGETREQIAVEKLGIARQGRPLVCGEVDLPSGFDQAVARTGAVYHDIEGAFERFMRPVFLPIQSAGCAIKIMTLLEDRLPVSDEAVTHALLQTKLPGRFEYVRGGREVWLDVAHNPQAGALLAQKLGDLPKRPGQAGRWHAVVGMLRDKAIADTLRPLLDLIDVWHLGALPQVGRGAEADLLAQALGEISPTLGEEAVLCYDSVESAYRQALLLSDEHDRIVVFGSFYTVAAVQRVMVDYALSH